MQAITLKQINRNILLVKREVDDIREMLEESKLELADEVKAQIEESRKRPHSQFRSQEEIEKKFL